MKHVVIIGAGVVGTLTAYYLAENGVRVTVLEREIQSAAAASGANASQLSFSYAHPAASFANIYGYLAGLFSRSGICHTQVDWADPALWRWLPGYLWQAMPGNLRRNQKKLLRQTMESRDTMAQFLGQEKIDFDYAVNGKLQLFSSGKKLVRMQHFADTLEKQYGVHMDILSPEECLKKEPALKSREGPQIAGGVLSPTDAIGDCQTLTRQVARLLPYRHGQVQFLYRHGVEGFVTAHKTIAAVQVNGQDIAADCFVIAAGAGSVSLARMLGFRIPVYPARGYTLCVPNTTGLEINVTDHARRMVFAPLGERLRFSGVLDFAGHDVSVDETRVAALKQLARQVFPALDCAAAKIYTGLRPMTPDSLPRVGKYKYSNLYLNTGHGMLGWTLSFGAARRLADKIMAEENIAG